MSWATGSAYRSLRRDRPYLGETRVPGPPRPHTEPRRATFRTAIGTSPAERAQPAATGHPRRGRPENGTTPARRPERPARRRSPPPLQRVAPPSGPPKTEYRRQASSLTRPAEKPGLRPPHVLRALMGHHAPPAAPWRQCDLSEYQHSEKREHRRPEQRMSAAIDEIKGPSPIHGRHRKKPAQHRQAVSADPIRDARATAPQIGTDSDSGDVRI
jgi:hypothetical protein